MRTLKDLGNSNYDKMLKEQIEIAFGQWFRDRVDKRDLEGLLYYGNTKKYYVVYDHEKLHLFGFGKTISEACWDLARFLLEAKPEYATHYGKIIDLKGDDSIKNIYATMDIVLEDLNLSLWVLSFNVERNFLFH